MARYVGQQLLLTLAVMLAVSVVGFSLLRASGDIAQRIAGTEATAADVAIVRKAYGLDRPLPEQYLTWLGRAVQGDFGTSLFFHQRVSKLVAERLPVTMTLGAIGLALALAVAIPLGIVAALGAGGIVDRAALALAVAGQAMPSFWLGLLLVLVFGLQLGWLPVSGSETWRHFLMPSAVLAVGIMPAIMRLTRSGMLNVLRADFVRTARAKGVAPARVVLVHALRNAVIPVVSIAAVQLGWLMSGSVVVESVFGIQGLGFLAWESIGRADFPVVQAIVIVLAILYCALTFVGDLLNAVLDPRIREA